MSALVDNYNDDVSQRPVSVSTLVAPPPQSPTLSTSDPSRASSVGPSSSTSSLKRAASPDLDNDDSGSRKRMREEDSGDDSAVDALVASNLNVMDCDPSPKVPPVDGEALAEDLGQELECGCCAGLIYKPVVINPCEHFFCGSCCVLWIRNGGSTCPKCRGPSSSILPSKPLQAIADVLARADPLRARSERERAQADEIYPEPRCLKFPVPREPSPEPAIPSTTDFLRPCPHCSAGNGFGYVCPSPIIDPEIDTQNAWPLEDGAPEGHAFCGNCENVLALQAPQSSKCDFCQVSFCGINVQGRCIALPLTSQHPHNMSDVGDLIQSAEVYDCFDGNTVEVEFMLDHMTAQGYTPKHVYREIVQACSLKPNGFTPMFDADLFSDIHNVSPGGPDPDPSAPRRRICRLCASEVMLYGLREWWIEERRKGFLEGPMVERKDCADGRDCRRQQDLAHAREFNHVIIPPAPEPVSTEATPMPDSTSGNSVQVPPSASPSPALSREGSVVTGLPSIRDLDIPFGSSFMVPPIFANPPSALQAILGEASGSRSSSTPMSSAPEVPPSQMGDDQVMAEQEHSTWASGVQEGASGVSSTLRGALLESVILGRSGYQVDVSAAQNAANMGYAMDPHGFMAGRLSDEAMDAAMERRVDAELEAHYVTAIRQALARTEEAEADLSSIRNQLRMQDGVNWGANLGAGSRNGGLPSEGNINNGHPAVALASQLAAE